MVSCIEVETASLVFACLSLFCSSMGTLACIASLVNLNIFMAYLKTIPQTMMERKNNYQSEFTHYGFYINIGLTIALLIVVVSLIFSIILTKGLISKKPGLVNAYFIYGVTMNTLSIFSAITSIVMIDIHVGLLGLFGCFLYTIILMVIKNTHHKLSTRAPGQFCHKKLIAENYNA